MIYSCFTNLENIVISEISKATNSIEAAIAWINFDIYEPVLEQALYRDVQVTILINNDEKNRKYLESINRLNEKGAKIRLVSFAGIMHHKFCVIDRSVCMFGSFNWTVNANKRNIEDLNICDEPRVIIAYLLELEALLNLDKSDVRLLGRPPKCKRCKRPVANILLMEKEKDDLTKVSVIQQCGCESIASKPEYYDGRVYLEYVAYIQQYEDKIAVALQYGDSVLYQQLVSEQDYVLSTYLSNVRKIRMGFPIIHAVGIPAQRMRWDGDYERYYKIIWKERGADQYVYDEYPIGV